MKTEIIPIGNSKGIRIPKVILTACGLNGTVDLEVHNGTLIISAARKPRAGWEEVIKHSIETNGAPESLWPDDMQDHFDSEWTWPQQKP